LVSKKAKNHAKFAFCFAKYAVLPFYTYSNSHKGWLRILHYNFQIIVLSKKNSINMTGNPNQSHTISPVILRFVNIIISCIFLWQLFGIFFIQIFIMFYLCSYQRLQSTNQRNCTQGRPGICFCFCSAMPLFPTGKNQGAPWCIYKILLCREFSKTLLLLLQVFNFVLSNNVSHFGDVYSGSSV